MNNLLKTQVTEKNGTTWTIDISKIKSFPEDKLSLSVGGGYTISLEFETWKKIISEMESLND